MITEADIPASFWSVRYNGECIPTDAPFDLSQGANCQLFAYALLAEFGKRLPPFRSSDLWEDMVYTSMVTGAIEPLDLLLFNPTPEAWGAHVALSLGGDRAIHLSQRVGKPAVWTLTRFREEDDYHTLLGGKRIR